MRLATTDLNLLVAFDALMAERSVTRAAERLDLGQPAMSATLRRLRRLFDDPLLVRRGRHMVPTPRADSLVAPVREALQIIEHTLADRSEFDPSTARRTFSVVASDYVTLVLLRPLLALLAAEAPDVHLHVRPVGADFGDQLRSNLVDLVIAPREVLDQAPGQSMSPLFQDRYVCAVSGDGSEPIDSLTIEEFSARPYVAYHADPFGSVAEEQLDALGITRNLEISVQSFLLAPYLLTGTRHVSLVHERLARIVQEHLHVRVVEPPIPLHPITQTMAWSPRHEHDPGHSWLRTRLQDLAGTL